MERKGGVVKPERWNGLRPRRFAGAHGLDQGSFMMLTIPLARERIDGNRTALRTTVSSPLLAASDNNVLVLARPKPQVLMRKSNYQESPNCAADVSSPCYHPASAVWAVDVGCMHGVRSGLTIDEHIKDLMILDITAETLS